MGGILKVPGEREKPRMDLPKVPSRGQRYDPKFQRVQEKAMHHKQKDDKKKPEVEVRVMHESPRRGNGGIRERESNNLLSREEMFWLGILLVVVMMFIYAVIIPELRRYSTEKIIVVYQKERRATTTNSLGK